MRTPTSQRRLQVAAAGLALATLGALVAPSAARAVRTYRLQRWRAQVRADLQAIQRGEEMPTLPAPPEEFESEDARGREVEDDATLRRLAQAAWRGAQHPGYREQLLPLAAEEARRWPELMPRAHSTSLLSPTPAGSTAEALAAATAISGQSWINLGPANASFEWNGTQYSANDSGRPNTIRVDPRNAAVVYLATSGGGIWKSYDFGGAPAHWVPITETLGNLAIGAMDLDPQAPDTLWVGLGDFVDTAGGQLVRSTDGGATWSAPMSLSGSYPSAAFSGTIIASTIRDLAISPTNRDLVLVATDVGLFRSTNATSASPTFALIDLPDGARTVAESAWSLAYLGSASGQSHWLVSGMQACAAGDFPPVSGASDPNCAGGELGDLWRSTDSGATWTSIRAAGGLSSAINATGGEVTRMALATAPSATPASATVYAQVGNLDGSSQTGIFKSTNGGQTWTAVATASSSPSNPTTSGDCNTLDVAHGQVWYNQAIAVDPQDPTKVLLGGNFCAVRSTNGGTTWDNVAHWLPSGGGGNVSGGTLPYVHADWHAITLSRVGGTLVAFAGTDGGLFSSQNVFSASPTSIAWASQNAGIVTHLAYSVASGDPVDGNDEVAFMGLQDNGTRLRDTTTATTFNQVIGGDGFGTALVTTSTGTNPIYWGSVFSNTGPHRLWCKPGATSVSGVPGTACNKGGSFSGLKLTLPQGDSEPFITRMSPVLGDTNSAIITETDHNIWRSNFTPGWTRLTGSNLTNTTRNVHAAPRVYGTAPNTFRLYGVALTDGRYMTGTDKAGTVTWNAISPNGMGLGTLAGQPALYLRGTSSITFPAAAANLGGATEGQAFLASTVTTLMSDNATPVPASVGHLFKTVDNGKTWTALHGNGTGQDLPNVAIEVVRFDPGDATDQTIYVGTDLGLYRSTDGGATWQRFGVGLPMVRISDVFIARNGGLLRVATYGRGIWEIYPQSGVAKGVNGDGDWDRNLQIDGLDLAALCTRMGTTPATASAPLYDWNVDLTGTQSAIDDADLTALLAKFGDHP